MPAQILGILSALTASISWGGGDFSGGWAARRIHQSRVLLVSSVSSLALLVLLAWLGGESLPSTRNTAYALIAGASGALGLAALYRGLSTGNVALVAPVAGVVGAILPMVAGILLEGYPSTSQQAGFLLALAGLWLVSKASGQYCGSRASDLGLALAAGIGFGVFLALIARVDGAQTYGPLVVGKAASLVVALVFIGVKKGPPLEPRSTGLAALSGFLDAGGNLFYLLATRFTRLDVVAVLGSLYPGVTVLLSTAILKEQVTLSQWIGALACIGAIMLIAS